MDKQRHDTILNILNAALEEAGEPSVSADEFTEALSALAAIREEQDHKLRNHFQRLDKLHRRAVIDLASADDLMDEELVSRFMKAALDDSDEHSAEDNESFNLSIMPDDVIRNFLMDDED